jgi:four helix bundle protein
VRDYRELKAWEKAHKLTIEVYRITRSFPSGEVYGLQSQMRRAASSIPTNLAEGCGRETVAELARFLYVANGSASELDYQLLLARDLAYIETLDYERISEQLSEVRRILGSYLQKNHQDRVRSI